jgi:hypothetical protein
MNRDRQSYANRLIGSLGVLDTTPGEVVQLVWAGDR